MIVAVDLQPSRCNIVAVRRDDSGVARLIAWEGFDRDGDLSTRLREFRRRHRLPSQVRLVQWPWPDDAGVTLLARKRSADVAPLGAAVVRERARVIVRAGFRVTSAIQPHQVLAPLAAATSAAPTIVLALEREFGCALLAVNGTAAAVTYFSWPALPPRDDEPAAMLARYQFGALLGSHVRDLQARAGAAFTRVLACGGVPDLRLQVVPLIEEIDHEVEVLDGTLASGLDLDAELPESLSAAQFHLSLAAATVAKPLPLDRTA